MSVSASIGLRIVNLNSGACFSQIKILEMLINCGWKLQRNGYVCYLPMGDNDNFGWTGGLMNMEELMDLLRNKERQGELIGVLLTWQNTEIGGDLLLWSAEDALQKRILTPVSFNLTNNRKILTSDDQSKTTDVNWYLTKLLPVFNQGDSIVEYYTFEEHV